MSQQIVDGKRLIDSGKRATHADCCCDDNPWEECTCPDLGTLSVTISGVIDCGETDPSCEGVNGTYTLTRYTCDNWVYSDGNIIISYYFRVSGTVAQLNGSIGGGLCFAGSDANTCSGDTYIGLTYGEGCNDQYEGGYDGTAVVTEL